MYIYYYVNIFYYVIGGFFIYSIIMFLSITFTAYTLFHYFILPFYLILSFFVLLFINKKNYNLNKSNIIFSFDELVKVFFLLASLLLSILCFYNSFNSSVFFNHLSLKLNTLNIHKFLLFVTVIYFSVFFKNISNINLTLFDIFKVKVNYFVWFLPLFLVNNFFTLIYLVEFLSVLVIYSISLQSNFDYSKSFKKVLSVGLLFKNNYNYFYHINSLIIIFWLTFVASVFLFMFLYVYFYTFCTLSLLEFNYSSTNKIFFTLFLFFILFLKLGISPFFFWKVWFFKGLNFFFLNFYITYYYFILFVFLVNFLLNFFSLFFFTNSVLLFSVSVLLFIYLFVNMYNVINLKDFFAFSSALNTLISFLFLNLVL